MRGSAAAVNEEIADLFRAGADLVQIDELSARRRVSERYATIDRVGELRA